MRFEIPPGKVLRFNSYIILALLILNLSANVFKHYFYIGNFNDVAFNFAQMFNFNTERNIPTLYSAFLLLTASGLLAFIGYEHKQLKQPFFYWFLLSFIFLFLTIDEISSFHELLTPMLNQRFEANGLLYFSWVIPYGIATLLFALSSLKFLATLPNHIKKLFIYSGLMFVLGALGMEMLGGLYAEQHGDFNMFYASLYTIEETFEMIGIALFIYALLLYIAYQFESPSFIIIQ